MFLCICLFYSCFKNLVDGSRQRYLLRSETLETLRGRLAITNRGIAFAKSQIRKGLQLFSDLDEPLVNFEDSDDEDESDDNDGYDRREENSENWSSDENGN